MAVIINGNNTPPAGGIAYGNATSELAFTAAGTAGQLVLSGGAGAPTFATLLPVANGGTGTATPSIVAGTNVTVTGTWPNQTINSTGGGGGSGTVTSVAFSGGTTGLTVTGSPITTSGTITLAGTLAVANGGTGVTTSTGTGNLVLSTSPTFVTPILGTPTSGVATNLTGLPLTTGVTGLLPVANGGTGTATPAIVAGTNVTVTGTWPNQTINATASGSGTVTSVAATVPSFLSVTGSPITTSGTLAISLSGTALPVANGGTGQTTYTDGQLLIGNSTGNTLSKATLTAGAGVTITNGNGTITIAAAGGGGGTVTSVAQTFTGGIISVAGSPITLSGTLALTVAGTSGGIPYFSSGTTWATSAALAANAIVLGGGAGAAPATTTTGTGVVTALGVNVGTAGAFVVNGGALGTPSSGTLTSATGLPISTGVSGLGTGIATALAVNVGTAGAPVINGGALGTPTSGTLTSATGLPISTGVSGLGTNVATALAVAVGSAGAPVVNGGVLGTPSSGTATNLTGLPLTTGVTGTLPVANGGTGATTLTANNVILGNGTSAPLFVAPSTAGNVLTSNGTTWQSTAPAAGTTDLLENAQIISTNYVIAALKNAIALGTITINTSSSVTVGTDQSWLIFS